MNHGHAHHESDSGWKPSAAATGQYIDPVCGMTVKADSPHHSQHGGRDYRFCSSGCRQKFDANPARYTEAKQPVNFRMRAELHMYERGRHGVGLGTDPAWTGDGPHAKYDADWGDKMLAWLKAGGVLEKK